MSRITDISHAEQKYLKAIYALTERDREKVSNQQLANRLDVSPASISDMITKLSDKQLISWEKYYGITLTPEGRRISIQLVRRQRLWETFLSTKLKYRWDQISIKAEALSEVDDDDLIRRMDILLGSPKWNPFGDPIPNAAGKYTIRTETPLADLGSGQVGDIVAVRHYDVELLQHLTSLGLQIGTRIAVNQRLSFDKSIKITANENSIILSQAISSQIWIRKL